MTIVILLLAALKRLKQRLGNWLFWPLVVILIVVVAHLAVAALTVILPVMLILWLINRFSSQRSEPAFAHQKQRTKNGKPIIDGQFHEVDR